MEGRVLARLRLAIPKPGEDAVRLLGEGGTWWGGWLPYPEMVEGSSPLLSRRQSSMHDLLMKEVDVVQMLRKGLGVCVLLGCIQKGQHG